MSYSNPRTTVYLDPVEQDLGAGTGTAWSFKGPSGKQGSLKNIGVYVTETFAGDQTTGKVLVGTTADPNYHGQLEIADGSAATDVINDQDDSNAVLVEALAADTQIEVTFVQCVDSGTAAGKIYPYVNVEWY
jgi:hypothetical protein|tara:strand:+ start:126 stop:521 length:396 start_codon:yes stop_codon:yes gene_type:complete